MENNAHEECVSSCVAKNDIRRFKLTSIVFYISLGLPDLALKVGI
jgi:hypothetical protein